MTILRHVCFPWAAFFAVTGILCVTGDASAQGTGRARAAAMFRKGCCCVTKPASGCCCETTKPISLIPPRERCPDKQQQRFFWSAVRVERNSGAGSCQCGRCDPASPGSRSKPIPLERAADSQAVTLISSSTTPEGSSPSFDRFFLSRGSPAKSPLYLKNSHLLI
jgi:hypothetical protein